MKQCFKSLEDKSDFLQPPILAFSNSIQYGLQEVKVLTNLTVLVWVIIIINLFTIGMKNYSTYL